mmetsp:Transcript_1354/g.2968  ORF Transcript_1354/g.2968 Transcript_1354/m.2968 type:complete len:93 (+) Transcript_1354:294-572(+)
MNFDLQVLTNPSGPAVVRQLYSNPIQQLWHDLTASQILLSLVTVALLTICQWGDIFDFVSSTSPYAFGFYTVRILTDWYLGIEWLRLYRYVV